MAYSWPAHVRLIRRRRAARTPVSSTTVFIDIDFDGGALADYGTDIAGAGFVQHTDLSPVMNYATSPAPLEGTHSVHFNGSAQALASEGSLSSWTDDWLWVQQVVRIEHFGLRGDTFVEWGALLPFQPHTISAGAGVSSASDYDSARAGAMFNVRYDSSVSSLVEFDVFLNYPSDFSATGRVTVATVEHATVIGQTYVLRLGFNYSTGAGSARVYTATAAGARDTLVGETDFDFSSSSEWPLAARPTGWQCQAYPGWATPNGTTIPFPSFIVDRTVVATVEADLP